MEWYRLPTDAVFRQLETSDQGLTSDEVRKRRAEHGPNTLAGAEKTSRLKLLLNQFASPLVYILMVAAVATALLGEYADAAVIAFVLLLNAMVGYFQEQKAEESVKALAKLVVPRARVLREGREQEVNSEELVPGDIIFLTSGMKVPADIRLLRTIEVRIDEAMLTGESLPAEKVTAALVEEHLTPGDQTNMAFMGTSVLNGRATGVVTATGQKTVLGTIANEVRDVSAAQPPIQIKIHRFARLIGYVAIGGAVLTFGLGVLFGLGLSEMFRTAVAVAVATVPEGLPIVVTVTLAIGVTRMARRNAIIRKLPAVETLGSTTVICSDKTGTLTKNEMTVRLVYDGQYAYEVTGSGYEPKGEFLHEQMPLEPGERETLLRVLRIGLLCNESEVHEEEGRYKVDGDPTEAALIVSAMKAGLKGEERMRYPRLAMIPFESEWGYMATLHQDGDRRVIFVKGAPEKVLEMCSECMAGGGKKMDEVLRYAHRFAGEGLRVIALAYKEVPSGKSDLTHADLRGGIIYAGLQGMIDPPRPEAVDAVEGCKEAGIRTVMITGDHAITAAAIARKLGFVGDKPRVVTGKELETTSDSELSRFVQEVSVYARVSPQHKLRIVQELVKQGEVVAVTGDGVNDAPALKAAHIGIAMGRTGTDVAKESSDMVVADDNFASIYNAVEEGRIVFENIRKVVLFLIPTGFAALIAVLATMLSGFPVPFVPAQILWINLVTSGLQDVALAFEPGERHLIKNPPRPPGEGIFSGSMIHRTVIATLVVAGGVLFAYFYALAKGDPLEEARTMAMTTIVFFQFFRVWTTRSETQAALRMNPMTNPFLFAAALAAFFAQLAVIYVPVLQWIFRTEPLTLDEWLWILPVTATVFLADEAYKLMARRRSA
jgi:Ca2+-transporting ATPase